MYFFSNSCIKYIKYIKSCVIIFSHGFLFTRFFHKAKDYHKLKIITHWRWDVSAISKYFMIWNRLAVFIISNVQLISFSCCKTQVLNWLITRQSFDWCWDLNRRIHDSCTFDLAWHTSFFVSKRSKARVWCVSIKWIQHTR